MKLLLGTSGMSKVRKTFSRAFLLLVMFCMFAVCSSILFGAVQASTEVSGILSSDTTWTKANSPYSLDGAILVSEGVTLTIKSGVTVNLNDYYILVNGTFRAIGNSNDKIYFNDGSISFSSGSTSWDEQSGSGCIIENAILTSTSVATSTGYFDDSFVYHEVIVALKINNNTINSSVKVNGGLILNNIITGGVSVSGSPEVSNNIVTGEVSVMGSPTVSNNNITGAVTVTGAPRILNNHITSEGEIGISMGGEDDAYICGNTISGFDIGIRATNTSTIEKNLIINNAKGIAMGYNAKPVIRNNTITNNSDGIYCPTKASTINYNNIQNNSNYNLFMGSKDNINATYNWWGTTDTQTINQTIYDFKKDFGLGKVTFVPFLTEPNPEAPKMPESQQPDTEPEPEPEQSDWHTIIIFVALIVIPIATGVGLLVYLSKRK